MTERLLQFIWQFQYFNKSQLTSVAGESVHVLFAGRYNTNQGPDFIDAKIRIAGTTWAGTVELHIKTSDWERHKHQIDSNYNNVVLHVVWEDDGNLHGRSAGQAMRQNSNVPVLELKTRVAKILVNRYQELMNSSLFIPCEKVIHTVPALIWISWKERLLAERLLRKAKTVEDYLEQNNYHWEETFWWMIARNFGMKVNADAFEAIARSVSLNILARQKHQIHQVEAILFGQAGLLQEEYLSKHLQGEENYPRLLQREYQFQQKKYGFKPIPIPLLFLRMRPGNFPTIRLAQLSMLIHQSAHLFSKIKEAHSISDVKKYFDITANDYWHYHYRFDETSALKKKKIGATMTEYIIINTICPVLFAYGNYHGEQKYKDKALEWLAEAGPEINFITKGFQPIGLDNKNAFDSQALIELKTEYCDKKKCLDCAVGNAILKN